MRSVIIFCLLSFTCSPKSEVRSIEPEQIVKHSEICAENSEDIFQSLFYEKSKETVRTSTGQVASLLVTSGTALTETVVYLGGGAAVGILVCSPIIAAETASDSKSAAGARCVLEVGSKVSTALIAEGGYDYTKKVWKNTKELREFDFDEVSALVRENCECYMETGRRKDLETAFKQIGEWKREHGIWEHLSVGEKAEVDALEKAILKKLERK